MEIRRESAILKQADEPTEKMLALWHKLCRDVLNGDLEVGVASRREYKPTKHLEGEINFAIPLSVNGNPMLVLFFDNLKSVEHVLITHELGHEILKLQGFKGIQKSNEPHSNEEILFNSMCQHPALYVLQRSLGHDPQHEIDKKARHDLSLLKPEPFALYRLKPKISAETVLYLADSILNCHPDISEALFAKLDDIRPEAAKCIRDICCIHDSFDPTKLDSYPAFVQAIMQRLRFGAEWTILDEIPGLKALASGKS